MLDRKIAPQFSTDFDLRIKNLESSLTGNGTPIYEVNCGTQDIIKVEFLFKSGRINEEQVGVARAAVSLMGEGTETKSSSEQAEFFDFYGAIVKFKSALESSSVSLVCLTRHFEKVWPVFYEVLFSPAFAESEVEKYAAVASQKLKNQITKNDVHSYRIFTEKIFGKNHPYGYNTQPEDIAKLKANDLRQFYDKNFSLANAFVILSGKYSPEIKNTIVSHLATAKKEASPFTQTFTETEAIHDTLYEQTSNEAQVSIKLGRKMFGRRGEHFSEVYFMNTLLGGYFGSRLMKNIREDKGYTYGIYSSLDTYKRDGVFYISSDVGNEFVDPCLEEISKEIKLLREVSVEKEEIDMVRNYLLGQSLHLIDGPFATAQLVKNIYSKDLEISDFEHHINTIKYMTADKVQEMAQTYLDENLFTTVLTGSFPNK